MIKLYGRPIHDESSSAGPYLQHLRRLAAATIRGRHVRRPTHLRLGDEPISSKSKEHTQVLMDALTGYNQAHNTDFVLSYRSDRPEPIEIDSPFFNPRSRNPTSVFVVSASGENDFGNVVETFAFQPGQAGIAIELVDKLNRASAIEFVAGFVEVCASVKGGHSYLIKFLSPSSDESVFFQIS